MKIKPIERLGISCLIILAAYFLLGFLIPSLVSDPISWIFAGIAFIFNFLAYRKERSKLEEEERMEKEWKSL